MTHLVNKILGDFPVHRGLFFLYCRLIGPDIINMSFERDLYTFFRSKPIWETRESDVTFFSENLLTTDFPGVIMSMFISSCRKVFPL